MASRNSRTNRKEARSSRAPQSARAVRSAKAAQSGRIAPYSQASAFSRDAYGDGSSYRAAYTPGSQGSGANGAYARQTAASQYSRNNPSYSAARKKAGRGKKIALGVIIAILVVAVGGGSAFALWKNSVNEKLIKGNKSDEEIMAINDALKPEKDMTFTEPFYMILIGTDEAEDSTEDMHRSDTNIVCASILQRPGHDGIHPPRYEDRHRRLRDEQVQRRLRLRRAAGTIRERESAAGQSRYRTTRK